MSKKNWGTKILLLAGALFFAGIGLQMTLAHNDTYGTNRESASANMYENNSGQGVKMELPKPGKALKLICKKSDKWFIVNTENDVAVVIFDTPGGTQSEYSLGYGNVIEALEILGKYVKFEYKKYDWHKQEDVKTFGYVDKRYLSPEPLYEQKQASYQVAVADAEVFLLPDSTSKKVLNLMQGETIQSDGSVVIEERRWIKAKFDSGFSDDPGELDYFALAYNDRYGWIQAEALLALEKDKVNESSVAVTEIPRTMRYSKKEKWTDAEREVLAKKGFYAEHVPPPPYVQLDDMVDFYNKVNSAKFITTDLFTHTWYLIFDRLLQDIEEKQLYPEAKKLTKNFVSTIRKEITKCEQNGLKGTAVHTALLDTLVYFSVPMKLFEPEFAVDDTVKKQVENHLYKILHAEEASLPEPMIGCTIEEIMEKEDYTQYVVRGHYEFSETLKSYFRSTMWFGRRNFLIGSERVTLSAILITTLLESNPELKKSCDRISLIIESLIGRSDKWSVKDYAALLKKVYGVSAIKNLEVLNDSEKLKEFQKQAIETLPEPKIASQQTCAVKIEDRLKIVSGFKFLGQKFNWDAYFFNQLTPGADDEHELGRPMPESLDIMNILGSATADELLEDTKQAFPWYEEKASALQKEYRATINTDKESWIYADWLDMLSAFFDPAKSKQLFAISQPWNYKQLNTALGSWTELKYSTILYVEQSYSVEGGEGPGIYAPPYREPEPKGYVEPNPEFFERLANIVRNIRTKLEKADFMQLEYADKLYAFEELVEKAKQIADKEVNRERMTVEDYRWMQSMIKRFDHSLLLNLAETWAEIKQEYLQMAVIADVHTDITDSLVLMVATGLPMRIYVVVKDASGGTRITEGYIYSWHEFESGKRVKPSEWKKSVYSPEDYRTTYQYQPPWYKQFIME